MPSTPCRLSGAALGALLLLGPAALAAQQFEGSITWQVRGDQPMEFVQHYKAGLMRMDMQGPRGQSGAMILDAGGKSMTMLMPSEKMFMKMDFSRMGGMAGHDEHAEHRMPKITAVGTSETIAGQKCDNFRVEEEEAYEICAAKGMGWFMSPQMPGPMGGGGGPMRGLPDMQGDAYKAMKDCFFPLRITELKGEKRTVMMEASKVERKTLEAALFQVPAGYTEMKMPGRP